MPYSLKQGSPRKHTVIASAEKSCIVGHPLRRASSVVEGHADNPSFTFSATKEVALGMLFGEVDATSAYMAGDITVEGNLQDAMAFQEIIELALEAYEDLADEL